MKNINLTMGTLSILLMCGVSSANINQQVKWSSDKYFICDTDIKNWPEIEKTGVYDPDSLKVDGFIHCTRANQLFFVANKFYDDHHMLLWLIDPTRLTSPVKYEGTLNSNLYPHVYGPINMSAVIDKKEMKPNRDRTYDIPQEFFSSAWKYHPRHFAFCEIDKKNWVDARLQGEYKPDDFDTLGYIPCLNPKNVLSDKQYSDTQAIILVVDMRKVVSPIKMEGSSNSALNPHIYGPLNMDAVSDVLNNPTLYHKERLGI